MSRWMALALAAVLLTLATGCSREEPAGAPVADKSPAAGQATRQTTAAAPNETADSQRVSTLARWKPSFDPSGAQFTYLLSCIGHPDIDGVTVGYNIRDEVWQRSNGRLYVDYRPLAQLGGEKDVLSKLRMGAVHGMLSSSVAAANLDDRLGVVNLPFLLDSSEKLEAFRADAELFAAFGSSLKSKGILVTDFTSYGSYGWASRVPVRTVEEARKVNFRIAEAPVNTELYKAWGMKFTVMPWPDVPQALQTGVIDGLDHTPIVCSTGHLFDNIKNFTFLNYAQGLYIHLINLNWLNKLPEDLRQILLEVISEQSARSRQTTMIQEAREIERAKAKGVQFWTLDEGERDKLVLMAEPIYQAWAARIDVDFLNAVRDKTNTK